MMKTRREIMIELLITTHCITRKCCEFQDSTQMGHWQQRQREERIKRKREKREKGRERAEKQSREGREVDV